MVKCEILEDGEQALFYQWSGKVSVKEGPKRVWLIRSKLERLQRFNAKHDEYLKITFKSGMNTHLLGPCSEFLNPVLHSSITVNKCHCLNANEAIIVYKKNASSEEFTRRIEYGPTIYMVKPNEWLHNFSWHGASDENKTKYVPGNYQFEILNLAPNQLYYNVNQVRTIDDALVRIKLMIFYELKDIEKMLNTTKDPIADMINCCSSDITVFTSSRTYIEFIETCNFLNDINNYKKLTERAVMIGYEVTKVVFRGYYASPKLQTMHDHSLEMRTKLKLEHESQQQENEKNYLNLQNNISRLANEQELELQKQINDHEIERIKNEKLLELKLREAININNIKKETEIKNLQKLTDENDLKCDYLTKLIEYNVDPTEYLLCSQQCPEKVIQICKKKQGEDFSNIHFHE